MTPCSHYPVVLSQLDLETKLLEGEHRDQMAQLEAEQDKLTEMKRRHQDTLEVALREREKVRVTSPNSVKMLETIFVF